MWEQTNAFNGSDNDSLRNTCVDAPVQSLRWQPKG